MIKIIFVCIYDDCGNGANFYVWNYCLSTGSNDHVYGCMCYFKQMDLSLLSLCIHLYFINYSNISDVIFLVY